MSNKVSGSYGKNSNRDKNNNTHKCYGCGRCGDGGICGLIGAVPTNRNACDVYPPHVVDYDFLKGGL